MTAIEEVINRFCGADPTRPALQKPICRDGRIVATDGRIAILCRRAFAEDLYARLETTEDPGVISRRVLGFVREDVGAVAAGHKKPFPLSWAASAADLAIADACQNAERNLCPPDPDDPDDEPDSVEAVIARNATVILDAPARPVVAAVYVRLILDAFGAFGGPAPHCYVAADVDVARLGPLRKEAVSRLLFRDDESYLQIVLMPMRVPKDTTRVPWWTNVSVADARTGTLVWSGDADTPPDFSELRFHGEAGNA